MLSAASGAIKVSDRVPGTHGGTAVFERRVLLNSASGSPEEHSTVYTVGAVELRGTAIACRGLIEERLSLVDER